jgi:histidyl-tRNA synthetase
VLRAVDKLPKIGKEAVCRELEGTAQLSPAKQARLFEFFECDVRAADLSSLRTFLAGSDQGLKGVDELCALRAFLTEAGLEEQVEIDLSIARGLDYYTGTIYETFVTSHPEYGSVMSGGRYDTLLSMFLKHSIPAVGISVGVDRLIALLTEMGRVEGRAGAADVYAVVFDDADHGALQRASQRLREDGIKVEVSLKATKLGKQLRFAERKGYRWVIIAGGDELSEGQIGLKDLKSGEQQKLGLDEVASAIRCK